MREFTDTQHGNVLSLLIIFQNKESRLQNAIKLSLKASYIKMELVGNILETVSAFKMNDAVTQCFYTHRIHPCSLVPYLSADCSRNSARSQVVSHHNPCCLIWRLQHASCHWSFLLMFCDVPPLSKHLAGQVLRFNERWQSKSTGIKDQCEITSWTI
jgi:hypothetical protein